MHAIAPLLLTTLLAASTGDPAIRQVQVKFEKGASAATLKGALQGDETVDYVLAARSGQSMVADLKASNGATYFNVLPPGAVEALFVGSTSGSRFEGTLPADGTYTIRVYLMRSAARRNEKSSYTLKVGIAPASKAAPAGPAAQPAP